MSSIVWRLVAEITMLDDVAWILSQPRGRFGIMPRPRGGDWLSDEIASLREDKVDVVVCLLTPREAEELELDEEEELCRDAGIEFISFPIEDLSVPESLRDAARLVSALRGDLRRERTVVLHCRQGIGRSSLMAAAVLVSCGQPVAEAFAAVESARCRPVPDTESQREWVSSFREVLATGTLDRI